MIYARRTRTKYYFELMLLINFENSFLRKVEFRSLFKLIGFMHILTYFMAENFAMSQCKKIEFNSVKLSLEFTTSIIT